MSVIEGHLIDLIDHITLSVDLTLWHISPALSSSLPSVALLHLAQVRASLSVDFLLSVSAIPSLVYFWLKIHSFHKYFPSQTADLPQDCLHWLSLLPSYQAFIFCYIGFWITADVYWSHCVKYLSNCRSCLWDLTYSGIRYHQIVRIFNCAVTNMPLFCVHSQAVLRPTDCWFPHFVC